MNGSVLRSVAKRESSICLALPYSKRFTMLAVSMVPDLITSIPDNLQVLFCHSHDLSLQLDSTTMENSKPYLSVGPAGTRSYAMGV